jgi:hypothetical protein
LCTLFFCQRSSLNSYSAIATVTGGLDTPVQLTDLSALSAFHINLPFASAGQAAALAITIPAGASLVPPDLSPSFVLGNRGATQTYSWTVTSETGAASSTATVSFHVALSNLVSWGLRITAPDGAVTTLTFASDPNAGKLVLPYTAAFGSVHLVLTPPLGGSAIPSALTRAIQLGARGNVTEANFTCVAEDGTLATPYFLSFTIQLSPLAIWTLELSGPAGFSQQLTVSDTLSVEFPYTAAEGQLRLAFTLSAGATADPADLSPVLTLAQRGGFTSYDFIVISELGVPSETFTVYFFVDRSPEIRWTADIEGAGLSLQLSQTSAPEDGIFDLPYVNANGQVQLLFTISVGAVITPQDLAINITLGPKGSTITYSYVVCSLIQHHLNAGACLALVALARMISCFVFCCCATSGDE